MNRREFAGTIAGCLAAGSAMASTTSMKLIDAAPIVGHCTALPGQSVFRAACGTEFQARVLTQIPTHQRPTAEQLQPAVHRTRLHLQQVEAVYAHNPHQFYLRFSASHTPLSEGIYRVRNEHFDWLLYLNPLTDQVGVLEAIINTQPIHV